MMYRLGLLAAALALAACGVEEGGLPRWGRRQGGGGEEEGGGEAEVGHASEEA